MNRFTVDTDLRRCDILSGALVILDRHRDGEKTTHGRQCGSECNDPKKFRVFIIFLIQTPFGSGSTRISPRDLC
jgi:hypothetical protein